MNKGLFIVLAGITGVGKTTTIEALESFDTRYTRVIVDTTRELRANETKKRHLSMSQFMENKKKHLYWGTNFTHGNHYGSPRQQVEDAIKNGQFLLSDYDIDYADKLRENFPESYLVYLVPPSVEEIKQRLAADARDNVELRMGKAMAELERFKHGEFDAHIDLKVLSSTGRQHDIAKKIHASVLAHIGKDKEI